MMLTNLYVTMEFACCGCSHQVKVTVTCSGKGLFAADNPVAAVNIPCPTCNQVNRLQFEPNGTVRGVTPHVVPHYAPEPSVN